MARARGFARGAGVEPAAGAGAGAALVARALGFARGAGAGAAGSGAPTLEQVRALAYAALLDHARRSDHAHALATLVRALASLIGAECWLWPQT